MIYLRLLENEIVDEKDKIKNIIIKIICLIFMLGITVCFSFMPYFITSCKKSNKFLSLSNSFSAGLFLSIGLIHILPESSEMLKNVSDIPISYIICFFSYALILFIEKVAFNSHSLLHSDGHSHENEKSYYDTKDDDEHHSEGELKESEEYNNKSNENKQNIDKKEQIYFETPNKNQIPEISSLRNLGDSSTDLNINQIRKNKNMDNSTKKSNLTSYLLLIALGFHGLFEGISLGIQSTTKETLFLFIAISLHKWAASLSLGISFVKSGIKKKQFITMILIFSLISPIGIGLGMILSVLSSDILAGIFLSITVGTFIYIACSEIIIDEFSESKYKYWKFIFFLIGAGIVIGLSIFESFSNREHHILRN